MEKSNLKIERADYVKERLNNVKNKHTEARRLSKELFISVSTIYRDYKSTY